MSQPKTILVTGATDGIGKETARVLFQRGHRVIVHGRTPERAERAAKSIDPSVAFVSGDLSRLGEVRALAESVKKEHPRLDVLLSNAGIFAKKRELTADGLELTCAVNHYAHFLLTHLLLDVLSASADGRVVNVSSGVHASGEVDMNDLQIERGWSGYGAYASSKLMNVLFSAELARRLKGRGPSTYALHPGVIATKLLREGFGGGGAPLAQGAGTSVMCAVDPKLAGVTGKYYSAEREAPASRKAQDKALLAAFYEKSAALVGVDPLPG